MLIQHCTIESIIQICPLGGNEHGTNTEGEGSYVAENSAVNF